VKHKTSDDCLQCLRTAYGSGGDGAVGEPPVILQITQTRREMEQREASCWSRPHL